MRKILPLAQKDRLTSLLYQSGLKPSVSAKKNPFKIGRLIFSADFEMAWAFRFSKQKSIQAVEKGLSERENVPVIVSLLEEFKIPITWATVGHLFLDHCERVHEKAHPEMPRPVYFENRNWLFDTDDWYRHDPCTNFKKDPAWYAPDLIDLILRSKIIHEIGCHTFSHIDFTEKNCPAELAAAEIDRCIKLALEMKIQLKSMVFPGGTAGNFKILAEKGFTCYRKVMSHNVDIPYIDEFGLVAIPSSCGLDKSPYGWPVDTYLKMAHAFFVKAIKSKMVCHFWFHPSLDAWYLAHVLPGIFEMAAKHRDQGDLEIVTMGALAEKVLQDDKISH